MAAHKSIVFLKWNVTYHRASIAEELHQILALQKDNLPQGLSHLEKQKEGYVTVQHSFAVLKAMNEKCPHIIAKHNNKVIGYALCMHPCFANNIDILKPMFDKINTLVFNEPYIVMGQICIAKNYRKQGVFRGLYNTMSQELKPVFQKIITKVDVKNTHSLQAHYAIGFTHLIEYHSKGQDWVLINLNI